ncbi:MAG TPA: hypothetical protein VKQ11_22425 [Candidatus Sulfotelmatobacter sp.]|nr:hypothetical protein [Candidatus Sulfotelmatobacter sp.]
MTTQPVENLELRAIEQRNQLHQSTAELKDKIATARQKLDPSTNLRERFSTIAIAVSGLALLAGYAAGALVLRR